MTVWGREEGEWEGMEGWRDRGGQVEGEEWRERMEGEEWRGRSGGRRSGGEEWREEGVEGRSG